MGSVMSLTVNRYHGQVIGWVSAVGYEYMEEYPVGPYALDIYFPEMKVGVEVDGPQHNARKDRERDDLILTHWGIRIIRFKVGTPKDEVLEGILASVGWEERATGP